MTASALGARNRPDLDGALDQARTDYGAKRAKSLEAFEAATQVMPGGNTRTVLFHGPFPFRAGRGSEAYLWDVDDNKVLNLLGDFTAGLFGHDNAKIRAAITAALDDGLNFGAHNTYEPRFAALICDRFSSIEKVRFTNSGTEANLMAITTARAVTGRSKILVFEGGYHGGVLNFRPGISTSAPFPWVIAPYNDTAAAVAAIRDNAADLAAVLVEPMLGSGGCVPGTGEFLAALREESERAGSLLILDEVMTSRLGGHGAQSLHGIAPDLTTLGKWIGGGMSFGAFGGRGDAMDIYDPRRSDAVPHAGTFQNNVLTMAAGITALGEIYTPEHAVAHDARGEALRDRLNGIADEIGVPVRSTGMGSLMNLHPTTRPITDHAGVVGADDRLRELIFLDLLDAGYYVARRGFIALQLPVTDDDLDGFANAYRTVLENRANILQAYG